MSAPDLSEHVIQRHGHVIQIDGGGGAPAHAHLVFFRTAADAGEAPFDQESGELLSSYFCENCEQISSSTICDPHLLPVENVVRTVGAKIGTRTRREGVGTRERLGKRVGSQQFGSG